MLLYSEEPLSCWSPNMMNNRLWIAIVLLILPACSDWPPAVRNSKEINALLSNTKAVRGIGITDNEITDIIQRFADLDYIYINTESKITDKSIAAMASLKQLRQIVIEDCSLVTDNGLKSLQSYPALRELILKKGTQLSSRGLQYLASLKNLQLLYISNWSKIKPRDLDELRKALPNCIIKNTTGK